MEFWYGLRSLLAAHSGALISFRYAVTAMSFVGQPFAAPSAGVALKRNSLPSRHIACMMTVSLRDRHAGLLAAMLLDNLQPPGLQAGKGEEWRPHEDAGQ